MNTAVINFTTEPKLKLEAQRVAKKIGIPLSLALNNYLKHLVQTKTVIFSESQEIPNAYLKGVFKKAEENYKKGNASPVFKNVEDSIKWLNDPSAKYQNGDRV